MAEIRTDPLVWAKDKAGHRYLCSMTCLKDPNRVTAREKECCVDDDSRLSHPKSVPGEGKLHFSKSMSLS
jgi:hypothetical protein